MKQIIQILMGLTVLSVGSLVAQERMFATAKQESSQINVYDEKGNFMFSRSGELVGYTSTTVTIKEGSQNKTYDSKGNFKFSR
jgi:hypothetical protein